MPSLANSNEAYPLSYEWVDIHFATRQEEKLQACNLL
jgi:hypothetical protein